MIENQNGQPTAKPLVGAAIAACATNLPDVIEPAIHPHHRQFFHGVVFAAGVGYGMYRLYEWDPTEDWQETLRFVLLVCGAAYLIHLALDAFTAAVQQAERLLRCNPDHRKVELWLADRQLGGAGRIGTPSEPDL